MNGIEPTSSYSSLSDPKRKALHLRPVDPGELHATDRYCYCGACEGWLDPEIWNWLRSFIHISTRASALRCADSTACIQRRPKGYAT
jgi:hypothetical protein